MVRKKILWLVSWYPNRNDQFDGDFIQRHARAAAIYHDIHVIFVTDADIRKPFEQEWNYATGLTEQIVYFKRPKGLTGRLIKQWRWKKLYEKAVEDYIDKNSLPDIVHVHVPWKAGLIALYLKKKYNLQYIVTEHWGIYNEIQRDNLNTKPQFIQNLLKFIYKESLKVTSVSHYLAQGIEKMIGKMEYVVIPNVVDDTLFYYKEGKYSKFTFIHVSNMVHWKKVDQILGAFKLLIEKGGGHDIQLIMIGNRNNDYIQLANQIGLLNKSVFFRGEIPYLEVAEEMRRAHCLVLFSDLETFSCVSSEALCCGLPVIAPHAGALPELLNKDNGILIASDDKTALVNAMSYVHQHYYQYNLPKIAEDAAGKYSYSIIAKDFDQLYNI
jgi:glycosyltransferase involved in cell wall biosynthesis